MSTTTINAKTASTGVSAAGRVHSELELLTARLRRDVWLYGLLAVTATAVGMLLATIVSDAVFQPESTGLRFVLWIPVLAASAVAIYRFVWSPLRDRCSVLALAWALEESRPELQERLTSTLLLAEAKQPAAESLVDAVAEQANRNLTEYRNDAVTRRDIRPPVLAAAGCVAVAAFCFAVWPQYLMPSLSNVVAPWKIRQLPYLTAVISPGHIAIAEGEILKVTASGHDVHACVLEFMDEGTVLSSTAMTVTATGNEASVLLPGCSTDQTYRVRSGSLVSDIYQITVHPRPVVTDAKATLQFPDYTGIQPAIIDDLSVPIAAMAGAQIELSVATVMPISDSSLTLGDQQQGVAQTVQTDDMWWHQWNLKVDEQAVQNGRIELISDHGVSSEAFGLEIQSIPDSPPTVAIKTPTLQHLSIQPHGHLAIQFEAADDFGLHSVDVLMQLGNAEPVRSQVRHNLDAKNHAAEYIFQPQQHNLKIGDQLVLWLVASDNRTPQYGGAQTAESSQLIVTVSDDAASVGEQQVTDEETRMLEALSDAIDHLHEAQATAQQIADATQQANANDAEDVPVDTNADAQKLQQQLQNADQALENLADSPEDHSALFAAEKQQIRDIADQEVEQARHQARMIPLTSDPTQQQQAADAARAAIEQAEERLETLNQQIANQADKLQQAAELDELARQQNALADQMKDNEPAPQQEQIADRLQELVESDPEAESEQFLRRADAAEQLAEKTTQLQQQQQQLTDAAENKTDQETREQLAQMIRTEQAALAAENQRMMEEAKQNEPNPANAANEEAAADAQQLMQQVTNDLAEQDLQAAEQNAENAKRKLQEAANPQEDDVDGNQKQQPRTEAKERDRLAERQERIEEAITAVKENNFEAATRELQQLITDRLQQVAKEAEELLDLPTDNEENQTAVNEAQQKLQKAVNDSKQAAAEPQDPKNGQPQAQQPGDQKKDQAAQQNQADQKDAQPQQQGEAGQKQTEQQAQQQQPGQQDEQPGQPQIQQPGDQKKDQAAQQNEAGQKEAKPQQQGDAGQKQAEQQAQQQPGQQDEKQGQPQAQQPGDQKKDQAAQQNEAGQKEATPQQQGDAGQKQAEQKAQQQQQKDNKQPEPKPQQQEKKKDAAESLKQASESLQQFCKSCRKCANCNKSGQSGSASGSSSPSGGKQSDGKQSDGKQADGKQPDGKQSDGKQSDGKQSDGKQSDGKQSDGKQSDGKQSDGKQPGDGQSDRQKSGPSQQLARTTDNAQKAARNPTPGAAKQLARELNKLADDAAQESGLPSRQSNKQKPGSQNKGTQQKQAGADQKEGSPEGNPTASGAPMGVGRNNQPDDVDTLATQLRGPSTSEWTRSNKRLKGNVLDRKSTQIPEAYRGVVEDYFEQLSRIESNNKQPEASK